MSVETQHAAACTWNPETWNPCSVNTISLYVSEPKK